jgi:hypothetical protein
MRIVLKVCGEQKKCDLCRTFPFFSENKTKKEMKGSGKKKRPKKVEQRKKTKWKRKANIIQSL